MGTGFQEAAKGYVVLWQWLVSSWAPRMTSMAAALDSGKYTADQAAADFAATAKLAFDTGVLVANEALDAVALITGQQDKPQVVSSDTFSTTIGLSDARRLDLMGSLKGMNGKYTLPISAVQVSPPLLAPKATDFQLRVDGTDQPGVTYFGFVQVRSTATMQVLDTVTVHIRI